MKYKGVIFDLDGTLLDTLADIADSANRVLSKMNFPQHKIEVYRYWVGDGAAKLMERALPPANRDKETVQACVEAFLEEYGNNWNVRTAPYEGIPEMLDEFARREFRTAVLSNKPHDSAKKCVAEFFAKWKFDIVLGERESIPRKPHPTAALEIAERLKINPAQFLYLGDTAVDMKTAVAAGMFPVGVLWGFRTSDELTEGGAKVLISHPMDIFELLDDRR